MPMLHDIHKGIYQAIACKICTEIIPGFKDPASGLHSNQNSHVGSSVPKTFSMCQT